MEKSFKSIALCFSGGGYRAACFSLGAMSLFEKVGLLGNVEAISTVSGGTITGVKYTQTLIDGKSFSHFFKEYYSWLLEDKLSKNAIKSIGGGSQWDKKENKHKRENPINAFAIEYNKFTLNRTLGDFQNAVDQQGIHLKRVVFNTTDFSSGLQFRFQNVKGTRLRFGNKQMHKYNDSINKFKLGDILASSSAFPGGFEPIGFPHDFTKTSKDEIEIGLMDGGIVDNQGASAFIKDNPKSNPHDLIFICDVASPFMSSFEFANKNKLTVFLTYATSLPIFLIALLITIFCFKSNWWISYTFSVIVTSALLVIQLLLVLASNKLKKATGIKQGLLIPPRQFGYFIIDRAKSLIKLATEVFLKNDRRQNANKIYENYGNDIVTTATIYELKCDDNGRPINQNDWEEIKIITGNISQKIKDTATKASAFGTTLWFSKNDKKNNILDTVIACGEFTTCYNLMAFLIRNKSKELKDNNSKESLLMKDLKALWNTFASKPLFLINERKQEIDND